MATEAPTMRRTPLFDKHAELGAKMVAFAGYEMPIQYEGIVAEHRAVRGHAGLFDLSHMGEFFFKGRGAGATIDHLVSSDIAGLGVGQARYGLLTNERGTIVDDVIVYRISDGEYMMVVNAANIAKDRVHVLAHLNQDVAFDDRSYATSLVAIQGPRAAEILASQTDADVRSLPSFGVTHGRVAGVRATLARTGYTGEDGFEVFVANEDAAAVWDALLAAGAEHGIKPIGLGARDTLRLEARFSLYGNDIDETTDPIEAGLGWTCKLDKEFTGGDVIAAKKAAG
ncbi:MAG TPA: glycine cleavage system aminomethyltransferase GcvT, partial [Candidatus Limnocylindria bacterium]|nr:glycine cleavage system aminomethyltransferase GcvT [Candidatus Limnocylindria bacterium]